MIDYILPDGTGIDSQHVTSVLANDQSEFFEHIKPHVVVICRSKNASNNIILTAARADTYEEAKEIRDKIVRDLMAIGRRS